MLSWPEQLELARALWQHAEAVKELRGVLQPRYFSNPALGRIVELLFLLWEGNGGQAPTDTMVRTAIAEIPPHDRPACRDVWESPKADDKLCVTRVETPSASWAVRKGQAFALFEEGMVFQGQIEALLRAGQVEQFRNRAEEVAALARKVKVEEDLVVTCLSDVRSERVGWLWKDFLPAGKVALLDGNPGLGKSCLLLDVAARLSRGAPMPLDGMVEGKPADTIILSAEDAAADTIRPRLEAAGADLSRVHAVTAVRKKEEERGFVVLQDVERLENLVGRLGAGLVIVDPLVAFLGTMDFHRDQDMRRILRALAGLAERRNCAVVCIRHLNKQKGGDVVTRGGGSIGIVGAARVGLLMAQHPTSPDDRVLAVSKTNLSRTPESLRLKLTGVPEFGTYRIDWIGHSGYTAEDLVR